MEKAELLFQMMEHPEQYDDQQWQEILADKECRELYNMMSLTKSAALAERYDRQADNATIQTEWEKFDDAHPDASTTRHLWRRVAASAAIAIVVFGIVAAAVHTRCFGLLPEKDAVIENTQQPATTANDETSVAEKSEETTTEDEVHLYDNVPLEEIINDMAAKYDLQVEWQSDEARQLRLYYQWEPSYSIDKVVDMLNSFESFSITRMGNKLIISDTPHGK